MADELMPDEWTNRSDDDRPENGQGGNGQSGLGRRAFMKDGALVLGATALSGAPLMAQSADSVLKLGLITDLHYADKPPAGSRHYRQTPEKLAEVADRFAEQRPELVVELGDLIDAADSVRAEAGYLRRINRDLCALSDDRHYVLGNHCVHTLTKGEFLEGVEQKHSYYSFDRGGVHFIVLDACFRSDGQPYGRKNFRWTDANIPAAELEWLDADLRATEKPTVVFAHQRLDVSSDYGVNNAAEVRKTLETSGKVAAVFQGHYHRNDHRQIGGIHYCTLVAMVEGSGLESNGYSLVSFAGDGTIRVDGFRKQADYRWS